MVNERYLRYDKYQTIVSCKLLKSMHILDKSNCRYCLDSGRHPHDSHYSLDVADL